MRKAVYILLLLLLIACSGYYQVEKTTTTILCLPNGERPQTVSKDTLIYAGTKFEIESYCQKNSKKVMYYNGSILVMEYNKYRIIE